jgi:hypothetical protein
MGSKRQLEQKVDDPNQDHAAEDRNDEAAEVEAVHARALEYLTGNPAAQVGADDTDHYVAQHAKRGVGTSNHSGYPPSQTPEDNPNYCVHTRWVNYLLKV